MSDKTITWWRTDLGDEEIAEVTEAIRRRKITQGELVEKLEGLLAEFLNVPQVILTANGSLALLAAMIAYGIGPGDEVIVPGQTFVATANAAAVLGARVRLVDVQKDRPLIDAALLANSVGPKTKAVIPVHLNGRGADIGAIRKIVEPQGVAIIEDAAQALGSANQDGLLGTQGDIGCFSLGITKLLTCGEGGALAVRDENLAERLRRIRNNGATSLIDNVYNAPGLNLRQTDLAAAIGIAQFKAIDRKMARLREVYRFYRQALESVERFSLLPVKVDEGELPLWIEVLCPDRDKAIKLLAEQDIQARPFHPALSESTHLDCPGSLPNATFFAAHGLILPSGPDQEQQDLERVIEALEKIAGRLKDWPANLQLPDWV